MKGWLRGSVLGGVSLLALGLATSPGQADVFIINQDNLGVACPLPGGCGTVTVTSVGATYTFNIDLTAASGLVLHQGQGANETIAFNLGGVLATGFTGPITAPVANVHSDGFGDFLFGVNCSTTTASGNQCIPSGVSPLNDFIFTVQATPGLHLTQNALGNFLALDVCEGACSLGDTGFAASSVVPGPIVGAGLPGLVAACGGLIALARRRRRQMA
jgi:hypothetical protein